MRNSPINLPKCRECKLRGRVRSQSCSLHRWFPAHSMAAVHAELLGRTFLIGGQEAGVALGLHRAKTTKGIPPPRTNVKIL